MSINAINSYATTAYSTNSLSGTKSTQSSNEVTKVKGGHHHRHHHKDSAESTSTGTTTTSSNVQTNGTDTLEISDDAKNALNNQ